MSVSPAAGENSIQSNIHFVIGFAILLLIGETNKRRQKPLAGAFSSSLIPEARCSLAPTSLGTNTNTELCYIEIRLI
jgi:hypothetical protein